MSQLDIFNQVNKPFIEEARSWADNHPQSIAIREAVANTGNEEPSRSRGWYDFGSRHTGYPYLEYADKIGYYDPSYQALWYAISDTFSAEDASSFESFDNAKGRMPHIINTVFHRTYALMGVEPGHSWLSKDLCSSAVRNCFASKVNDYDLIRNLSDYYFDVHSSKNNDMYRDILSDVFRTKLGKRIYWFDDLSNKKLDVPYDSFEKHGEYIELMGVILNNCLCADGRYPTVSKLDTACAVIGDIMCRLAGRNDINAIDIKMLVDQGIVKDTDLFHAEHYHNHLFRQVTQEDVQSISESSLRGKPRYYSEYVAVKDSLSKQQRFSYFMAGSKYSATDWRNAILDYAVDSGEILTFKEALSLYDKSFNLTNTEVYSRHIDASANPDKDIKVVIDLSDQTDVCSTTTTTKSYCVSVESDYFNRDHSGAHFLKQIDPLYQSGMTEAAYCGSRYALMFEFEGMSDRAVKSALRDAVATIKMAVSDMQENHIGVGDTVEIVKGNMWDVEDYTAFPIGHMAKVTDVYEDEVKIEGNIAYLPLDILSLTKKYKPEIEYAKSLAV